MISYDDMPKDRKKKLEKFISEKFSESDIDISEIKIENEKQDKLTFKKGDIEITIPAPDKSTTNDIWKVIAGGAIALTGVYIGKKLLNDDISKS